MNDLLVPAEENQQNLSSLIQDEQNQKDEEWKSSDFQFSPRDSFYDSQIQTHQDNSIIDQLPIFSKICESPQEVKEVEAENKQIGLQLQQLESYKSENKSLGPPSSLSSNSQAVEQATVTLHEATIASKIYEQIQTEDDNNVSYSASLKNFLVLNEKDYHPHVSYMKILFQRMKKYSQQSLENIKLHLSYLQIKMKQQIQSLKTLDEIQSMLQSNQVQLPYHHNVDNNEKMLLGFLSKDRLSKKIKTKKFYNQIKEIYQQLLSLWRKIKQKRQKRQRFIEEDIICVIDKIQLEMQDIIKCRLLNEKQKIDHRFISQKIRSKNQFITKDKYLQLRYLMQREQTYLKLITDFNGKIITYMASMFSNQEQQINNQIRQSLSTYAKCYMNCYDENIPSLNESLRFAQNQINLDLNNQLADILLTIIPKELYVNNHKLYKMKLPKDKLEFILSEFSSFMQNNIFLTTIEMNNDYILFRNEATWKTTRSILEKQESNIDYQSKETLDNSRKEKKTSYISWHRNIQDAKIVVVLTSNNYLHLEKQDKVATIKLSQVKISKKGKQIIVIDRKKGFGGLFSIKTQFGRIQFQNVEDVDIFAQKLSLALKKLPS